jgi:aldose 1-epimerase
MGGSKGGNVKEECVGDGLFIYTLERGSVRAVFTNWGATLMSLCVPDAQGEIGDIVLGFDTLGPYMDGTSPYFGAVVGRCANRIARGTFVLDGERYNLPINNGPNSLHGGLVGFDKVLWEGRKAMDTHGPSVQFTYHSHDGEQGYPGDLDVSVTYTLSSDNELRTEMEAKPVNKTTPVNLANHSYFNLGGHGSGSILQHKLQLWSTRYTPVDETQIPTGEILPVQGTPFDFTNEELIGSRIHEVPGSGYDHNFELDSKEGLRIAAKVWDPVSKRAMEVFTTAPGVQFYTGNFLDGIVGKNGAVYNIHSALCLETQGFPNAVNEPKFPSVIVRPGETYKHVMVYKFYTQS